MTVPMGITLSTPVSPHYPKHHQDRPRSSETLPLVRSGASRHGPRFITLAVASILLAVLAFGSSVSAEELMA